jgi:hypothetical protein
MSSGVCRIGLFFVRAYRLEISYQSLVTMKIAYLLFLSLLRTESFQIFDNIISEASRKVLHHVACENGLSHNLFHRSVATTSSTSPLENALMEILNELDDSSPYFEYWCRQEWRHIEAHADVDENRAKLLGRTSQLRYPTHGHVLYLQVGTHVRGPTCLFDNCTSGGDIAMASCSEDLRLITVPAVEGRLLRFPGHILHAVPRPTDLWTLPFLQGSPPFTPTHMYERSVVLFNTWQDAPMWDKDKIRKMQHHHEETEKDPTGWIMPSQSWTKIPIVESCSIECLPNIQQKAKIWLLGDAYRRNYTSRTVSVFVNEGRLQNALNHPTQPYRTILSHTM